jgi:hypothetical protein
MTKMMNEAEYDDEFTCDDDDKVDIKVEREERFIITNNYLQIYEKRT